MTRDTDTPPPMPRLGGRDERFDPRSALVVLAFAAAVFAMGALVGWAVAVVTR